MVTVTHSKVSAKADGPDSTRIRPSDWNDDHVVEASTTGVVLGRTSAGPGPVEEIAFNLLFPAGIVLPFAGTAAPANWALCFGQAVSRTGNPRTFAALGTTYGPGNGSTTFNLPDLRGVAPVGKVNMGGADRGILSGGTTLGALLGTQSNSASIFIGVSGSFSGNTAGGLSVAVTGTTDFASNLGGYDGGGNTATPNHQHAFTGNGGTSGSLTCGGGISGAASGTSSPFSIVQPSIILNYIINLG
jgi:microcystin-dependent protein